MMGELIGVASCIVVLGEAAEDCGTKLGEGRTLVMPEQ